MGKGRTEGEPQRVRPLQAVPASQLPLLAPKPEPQPLSLEERLEGEGTPRRAQPAKKKRRGFRAAVTVVVALVLVVVGGATVMVLHLNGLLNRSTISSLLGNDRPTHEATTSTVKYPGDPFGGHAVNLVLIGTDSRAGDSGVLAGDAAEQDGSMRSDTTLLLHISADRTQVYAMSIPRDTLITMPPCKLTDGSTIKEAGWKNQGFNAAFSYGSVGGNVGAGAACTIRTIETMTGVPVDGFIAVDFAGFANIIDALGGVDICLAKPINSPKAGDLTLPIGTSHLGGDKALQFARARTGEGLGDGSDLQRIERQQYLLGVIAKKALTLNYLTDFPTLYDFVGSVAAAMTTDIGSVTKLAGFAYSLKDIAFSDIQFITMPYGDAGDNVHVSVDMPHAKPIFLAFLRDQPLPPPGTTWNPHPSPGQPSIVTPTPTPEVPPTATTAPGTPSPTSSASRPSDVVGTVTPTPVPVCPAGAAPQGD